MARQDSTPLAFAATLVVVAGAVLLSLHAFGQFALKRMLAHDAIATAEIWLESVRRHDGSDLIEALRDTTDRELSVAQIDRVVLIPRDGATVHLGTAGDEEAEFQRVVASEFGQAALSQDGGVYTDDAVNFVRPADYRSWVLFPLEAVPDARLAVRVVQTATAAELVRSMFEGLLFNGGVAAITFGSFMAGYSYRQRRLAAENAAIRFVALHDPLTGLPNRKQFEEFMGEALLRASQDGAQTALFVLDLDGFKAVNDALGHPVGDGLLKAAAKRLKASLRGDDLLARLSGDEFVIVVPRVTDSAMLARMADRILQLLVTPFKVDGHEIHVGCSIGLALAPDNGKDTGTLMRNADFALYRAKTEGRQTWRFFNPKMAEDLASRRTLEDGLRQALANDNFQLLYQPQVELSTGEIVGYEAMLRWSLPGKDLVPASVFVSLAEETGLVVPIGEWVIRQVARDSAAVPAHQKLAINLSSAELKRDGIEEFLEETMKSHKIAAGRLQVEVNESILGRSEAVVFSRLEKIRGLGIGVVLDSFGAGSISLGLLSRYGFDKIKVDRAFLMDDEEKSGVMLAAVCGLGHALGFRVAGQGVETAEHAGLLRAAGCVEAQGFYFAPPMPLDELLRWQRERTAHQLATVA